MIARNIVLVFSLMLLVSCADKGTGNDDAATSSTTINPGLSSNSTTPSSPSGSPFAGILPTVPDQASALARKAEWVNTFYLAVENSGTKYDVEAIRNLYMTWPTIANTGRILWDNPQFTVSEGIGYGMLIAVFSNDMELFTRLWRYHMAFRREGSKLMQWKVTSFYEGLGGGATDADFDVLTALLIAYEKNPTLTIALDDALAIANEIWNVEVLWNPAQTYTDGTGVHPQPGAGSYLLSPGPGTESWGVWNPSYFSPVAFRLLAKHDPNPAHNWTLALDKNLAAMKILNDGGLGLFPDWVDFNLQPKNPGNGSGNAAYYDSYSLEAVRIPWRLAWDYRWYGNVDNRSGLMLARMANFFKNAPTGPLGDVSKMMRYKWLTGEANQLQGMGMQASMCVTFMASEDYRSALDACNPIINGTPIAPRGVSVGTVNYFNPILQVMYTMLMNGLFDYKPI